LYLDLVKGFIDENIERFTNKSIYLQGKYPIGTKLQGRVVSHKEGYIIVAFGGEKGLMRDNCDAGLNKKYQPEEQINIEIKDFDSLRNKFILILSD